MRLDAARDSMRAGHAWCSGSCALVLLALTGTAPLLTAHDISRSESTLDVRGREVDETLTVNLLDFHKLPDIDLNHDGAISYDELDRAIEPLYAAIRQHYVVRTLDLPIATTVERYRLGSGTMLSVNITYRFAADVRRLQVESTLDRISQADHRHVVIATLGGVVHEAVLDAHTPSVVLETDASAYFRTVAGFLRLGFARVLTGYDHLAFLTGLLIATASFRSGLKTVGSFAVAHSLTLALATFDVAVLPARLTEILVAASIGYVGLDGFLQTRPVTRYCAAFLCGLIHGFGLSTVLRDMQLPRPGLLLSLVSFNAGIEIGQLVFVAGVLQLLYLASSRWRNQARHAASLGVMSLAAYWLVQRAILN
jgi:hypothetical protein